MSRPRSKPDRKPAVRITDDMWLDALKLHNKGLSWVVIGKRFNVTGRALARRYQHETGNHSRPSRRAMNRALVEQILDLRAGGASVRAIEIATGFGAFAIHTALRDARDRGDSRAAYRAGAAAAAFQEVLPEAVEPDPFAKAAPQPTWLTSRVYLSMSAKVGAAAALDHMAYLARRREMRA